MLFITPIYLLYIYCTFTQKKLIFHFEKTYSWPYCYLSPLYIILSHLQSMDQYILSISIACKWRKIKLTWHIAVSHLADTFITECIEHIDEIRECDQYSKGNSKWFSEMWTQGGFDPPDPWTHVPPSWGGVWRGVSAAGRKNFLIFQDQW